MKNRISDVRNHLVAMLEALGDPEAKPEVVERAKAASMIANSYIGAVKVELDAYKLAGLEQLPDSMEAAPDRPRLVSGGRRP